MNPTQHEFTRWRELSNPVSPLDIIQPDSPRYDKGKIPVGFVVLLWDGTSLIGPRRFNSTEEADAFVKQYGVIEFLVIPKPANTPIILNRH